MPFDTFTLESAVFLGLITILSSLPTDPYFHPWHDNPPSYRISYNPYRRPILSNSDPRLDSQLFSSFGPRNHTRTQGGSVYPFGVPSHDTWFQLHPRGETPVVTPRSYQDFEGQPSQRRSSSDKYYSSESQENPRVQTVENSYSSHVNCEAANQKNKTRDSITQKSITVEEITIGETTRTSKEVEIPNLRIVTPKRGRRPAHGSTGKDPNRPLPLGGTNTITTTEKTFRNQTVKGTKRPRPSSKPQGGGEIIFPDRFQTKFIPRVTKCAKKSTFCEHVGEEYPTEYISQVLSKEGAMFKEFFGQDVISDPNITERINGPEENSLCPYRQEVVFPRAAQNKEDKWLFIINQDQYVQGVTVEVCLNPESRCILTEGFPLGYTPYCKQKYIERRLVAIGEDGKPHSDSFRLPSCCSCVVKHETSLRMGLFRSSAKNSSPPR